MTDPLAVLEEARLSGDPARRASEEALASWSALAEAARVELVLMGFSVAVVEPGDNAAPAGGLVVVHPVSPFGVTLDWKIPSGSAWPMPPGNGWTGYGSEPNQVLVRVMLDVLGGAGFAVLVDHQDDGGYLHRVLGEPEDPLH
ncbi:MULTISPECIES: hypothetical protein [Actinosynnema]|uniref:hypothetical protein n=1 Tax=Actinosynnema TaxID=40566 RepID=UPI0020A53E41|nr:hypothetical protein [Actinosynnema pretiosum]